MSDISNDDMFALFKHHCEWVNGKIKEQNDFINAWGDKLSFCLRVHFAFSAFALAVSLYCYGKAMGLF